MITPQTEITVTQNGTLVARHVFAPGDYVIGRDSAADIQLTVPRVSRRHARLIIHFSELFIEDLQSSNGTLLGGTPLAAGEPARIWPSQKIEIGDAVIETHRIKPPDAADESLPPDTAVVQKLLPEEVLRDRKYEIGKVIAQGGMGAILDARDAAIQRAVAMKVMLQSGDADGAMRFIEEARITGKLEHPNIVPIHELGIDEHGKPFYTMKLVKGITLHKVLSLLSDRAEGIARKYPLPALLTVFQKTCDALAFAHTRRIIHRDIKPENIMIGGFGEVLLMDWGLSKVFGQKSANDAMLGAGLRSSIQSVRQPGSGAQTMEGTIMGTPHFMAPEQARGEIERLDARSDIFSLGAILYQILTLQLPFPGATVEEVLESVRAARPVPPIQCSKALRQTIRVAGAPPSSAQKTCPESRHATKVLPHLPGGRVPEALSAVAMKALALRPEDRYQSVEDLQADLTAYQSGFATSAEHAGLFRQIGLAIGRHRREAAILAASLLLLFAGGAYAIVRVNRERDAAVRALAALAGTAPTFSAQAHELLAEGKPDEALEKISYAIDLAPGEAEYHRVKANLLEAMQRLPEALAEYRQVLILRHRDESAGTNLNLCERLLAANSGHAELPSALQDQLLESLRLQGRELEASQLAVRLGRNNETPLTVLRARLKEYIHQPQWTNERLGHLSDGSFSLDLRDLQVSDLRLLRDLPVSDLDLSGTNVIELSPLEGMALKVLRFAGTGVQDLAPLHSMKLRILNLKDAKKVRDISPLAGMPLEFLSLDGTSVSDLRPLVGMPLEDLNLDETGVSDLQPLVGLPLKRLSIQGRTHITDFRPLTGLPLTSLELGWSRITDLSPLHGLRLTHLRISNDAVSSLEPLRGMPLNYLSARQTRVADLRPLVGMPLEYLDVGETEITDLSPLHGLPLKQLQIWNTNVSDLTPIRGMPLENLSMGSSKCVDFSPLRGLRLKSLFVERGALPDLETLRGMPLERLDLAGASIRDLGPLSGMPLKLLRLEDCRNVTDLTPLASFHDLHFLILPPNARDIAFLRTLPKIQRISFHPGSLQDPRRIGRRPDALPLQTASEFWQAFDKSLPDLMSLRNAAFRVLPDGGYEVNMEGKPLAEIPPLDGLPIRSLNLRGVPVKDLTPFAGLPLKELILQGNPVSDLRPLAGMALERLDLRDTQIASLDPLRGMPLHSLDLRRTKIADLSPLGGMPLDELFLSFTQVSDLRPLHDTPLKRLQLPSGTSDFTPLKGLSLRELYGPGPKMHSLEPLRGLPLEILRLPGSPMADLSPLRGMPLKVLNFADCPNVTDLSPLTDCRELTWIILPPNAKDVAILRQLPKLERISKDYDPAYPVKDSNINRPPAQTAVAFWAEWDRTHQVTRASAE